MEIVWICSFFIVISTILELLTLQVQMYRVYYLFPKKVNQILKKNWGWVILYGLVAIVATPITVLSVFGGFRHIWEEKLFNSIKNNLYNREKI